ncbi:MULTISPECIES: DoxX family protein [Xanthomonas]|uniref:Oxidoreductase MhqP n=2 Tax=Xanthomonas hortorum TaxID=56454 RepID=A0A6V7EQ00_9XANT|nr:DoxX family protein [Xanthomonas hortorum]CAD7725841.1 Putative oxidoreductase MhqP [Xanthomonas hydrangeae]APP79287.1 LysR family transcriptional regulator [Xanthomonas hortorum pv. gardneri]EGD21075.1 putative membrane protein [Xanthomonas hortorum ATCC 19865]KLA95028.1 LysR family transcriptional regulator [Xanthomonas hortorum pv. gardneri]KLA95450.1 LysR family transcriptional regulator [Xanthomonas hortorum pv. gardneri]
MSTSLASPRTAAYGTALLRISLGALFLVHGLTKLLVFTPAGTAAYFQSLGLPGALGYLTIALELGLGLSLLLGIYARWVALLGVPLLLGTIVSVHGANGFGFSNPGGGWEYPALWAVLLIVQSLLGDGALALKPAR